MRSLLILVGLALCVGVLAQDRVYKRVNPDGSVDYSDQPTEDTKVMKVPKDSTFTMPSTPPLSSSRSSKPNTEADPAAIYESIEITAPENDEAIRSNEGRVTAIAKSVPMARKGHSYRWSMDGRVLEQKVSSPILQMINTNRGTHNLEVAIVDSSGNTLITSDTIVFHLQRVSVGN